MKELSIVILSVDDWEVLYVNGEAFDQGHSVEFDGLMESLIGQDLKIVSFESKYIDLPEDNQDLDKYGNRFPFLLADVEEYTPPTLTERLNNGNLH